jgi:hypothetical protein
MTAQGHSRRSQAKAVRPPISAAPPKLIQRIALRRSGQKRTLPAAVRMSGWGRERSSHFESVLPGAPHVPERAGCDADNGMRMIVATRAKPDEIVPS